jgi:hypothetical protein
VVVAAQGAQAILKTINLSILSMLQKHGTFAWFYGSRVQHAQVPTS